jgi:hypothetical protein
MQNVFLRFTKWINFTQSRTGHLFQGRCKALMIDADAYLLELVRYVHLNPVRAKHFCDSRRISMDRPSGISRARVHPLADDRLRPVVAIIGPE